MADEESTNDDDDAQETDLERYRRRRQIPTSDRRGIHGTSRGNRNAKGRPKGAIKTKYRVPLDVGDVVLRELIDKCVPDENVRTMMHSIVTRNRSETNALIDRVSKAENRLLGIIAEDAIVSMYVAGRRTIDIAAEIGCSKPHVTQTIKRVRSRYDRLFNATSIPERRHIETLERRRQILADGGDPFSDTGTLHEPSMLSRIDRGGEVDDSTRREASGETDEGSENKTTEDDLFYFDDTTGELKSRSTQDEETGLAFDLGALLDEPADDEENEDNA